MDIVLIPGALTNDKLWQYQQKTLEAKARLHYIDLRSSQTIQDMAYRFITHAPEKFALIGFSMGGYVALELLSLIPNKIEKLVLINSGAKKLCDKGKKDREQALKLIEKGKFDLLVKLIFKNSIYNSNQFSILLPIMEEMAYELGVETYKKQLQAILNKPDQTDLLAKINCPTLLIAGRQDKVMPYERSWHMSNHIKHSKLILLNHCGHLAMLEQSEKINQIIFKWL